MKLNMLIENEFSSIFKSFDEQNYNDKKLIVLTLNNANEELKLVLNNMGLKHINLPLQIAELLSNINNLTSNRINNLTKSLEEIILFAISSPFLDINKLEDVEEKYLNKINEASYDNTKLQFIYDNIFRTYIYELVTLNKLDSTHEKYNTLGIMISKKQKEILDNIEKIISNKKKNACICFDRNVSRLIKNVGSHNTKIKNTNIRLIKDYISSKVNENNAILINKSLRNLHNVITKNISKKTQELLSEKKNSKQEIKENNLILEEYLLNYVNGLYDKLNKQSRKLVEIIYLDKKSLEEEINKYDNLLSKIMLVEYNFDKQFTRYKKNIIKNKQIFTTNKVIDQVNDSVKELEINIANSIKENVINVLKDEMLYFNQNLIKYNQVEDKINNKTSVLTDKEIANLFK